MGIVVVVDEHEPIDKALKRFRKACEDDGLFREIKNRERFMKRSDKARIAKREAKRKHQKNLKKERDHSKRIQAM